MNSRGLNAATLFMSVAALSPALAKSPAASDEAAVRAIIAQTYAGYSKPFEQIFPERPDGSSAPDNAADSAIDGYQPPYSASLDALIQRWMPIGSGEELVTMNSFDWYCQCQDYDPKSARVTAQKYSAKGKDKIIADVRFAPAGGKGQPITFYFIRENGAWVMDDLKLQDGSTLRGGLNDDITGAALTNAT
jgi:Protein of unknown function (DUF3828)